MKKLTKEQKQELLDFIDDQEIEVSELESYRCFSHNQDFARFAEPDDEDWDEDEEYNEMCSQAIRLIQYDGLSEYTNISDDMKEQAIEFIESKMM